MICCFLYQWPFRMILPYTSTSLKRKKTLGCGPRRLCFIRRPSPIRTRLGWYKGFPDGPNEFSIAWIRSRFSSANVSWSTIVFLCLVSDTTGVQFSVLQPFFLTVPLFCLCEMLSSVCLVSLMKQAAGQRPFKASALCDIVGLSGVSSALRQTRLARREGTGATFEIRYSDTRNSEEGNNSFYRKSIFGSEIPYCPVTTLHILCADFK